MKLSLHAAIALAVLVALEILWTEGARRYWMAFEARAAMRDQIEMRFEPPALRPNAPEGKEKPKNLLTSHEA